MKRRQVFLSTAEYRALKNVLSRAVVILRIQKKRKSKTKKRAKRRKRVA